MKKVLLTTLLLASSAAMADSALTGIHLGVDAGLQRVDFKQYLDTSSGANKGHSKVKKPSYQLTGAVSLGYFKDSGDLHYGAKLSYGHVFGDRIKKPVDSTGAYTGLNVKTKQQYSLTLAGQLGTYVSSDTIVYGSLGVKRLRYDLEVKTSTAVGGNVGQTLWGPVVGLGMKKSLTDSWAFNTELSYESYSKAKTGNLGAANNLGMSVQPRIWSVVFGFSHKF
jgi:hypothetical protein